MSPKPFLIGGAVLIGGDSAVVSAVKASFNLQIQKAGDNYQLQPGLVSGALLGANVDSKQFNIRCIVLELRIVQFPR